MEASNWNGLLYAQGPAKLIGADQNDREGHNPKEEKSEALLIFTCEITGRSLDLVHTDTLVGRIPHGYGVTHGKKYDGQ
jgi:hypothetical protein